MWRERERECQHTHTYKTIRTILPISVIHRACSSPFACSSLTSFSNVGTRNSSLLIVRSLIGSRSFVVVATLLWIVSWVLMLLLFHFFLDRVDHFVRYAQILDHRSSNVTFVHSPKFVSFSWCADHLTQVDVHPIVTADQMTVERFAILQFDQLWCVNKIWKDENQLVVESIDWLINQIWSDKRSDSEFLDQLEKYKHNYHPHTYHRMILSRFQQCQRQHFDNKNNFDLKLID